MTAAPQDPSAPTSAPLFTGIGVALVTLFDDDGALLADRTAELAATLVDLGVQAVLLAGTTGEPWALNADERIELCAAVRGQLPAGTPILLGTGGGSWEQTEQLTRHCADAGADALLITPPPGHPADAEHFTGLRALTGDTRVWAYHVPVLSAPGVPVGVLPDLPADAIKDSSGSADRLAAELAVARAPVYVGSPMVLALAGRLGATGALLAIAATHLPLCVQAFAGDLDAQAHLAAPHLRSLQSFPAVLKQTIADRYGTSAATRPAPVPDAGYGGS